MKRFLSVILCFIVFFSSCICNHWVYAAWYGDKAKAWDIFIEDKVLSKEDESIIERAISTEYDLPTYKDFLRDIDLTSTMKLFLSIGAMSSKELIMYILTSNRKISVNFAKVLIRFESINRKRILMKKSADINNTGLK